MSRLLASTSRAFDVRLARMVARDTIAQALCPALAAAHAVRTLNKQAKIWTHIDEARVFEIYRLKPRFIREIYEAGFGCVVRIAEQRMLCWRCDGTGIWCHWRDDLADTCWKCDGTGIHRIVELLEFTFVISGQTFVWHQPRSLTGWYRGSIENDRVEYSDRARDRAPRLAEYDYEVLCETVAAYIDSRGLQLEPSRPVPSWRYAIRQDWRHIVWALKHPTDFRFIRRIQFRVSRVRAWLAPAPLLRLGLNRTEDDGLPF